MRQKLTSLKKTYEILANHFEAVGGLENLKKEKSSYFEAEIEILGTGLKGTLKSWNELPIKSKTVTDLTVFKETEGDNGEFFWKADANNKVQISKDESKEKERQNKRLLAEFEHLNQNSKFFKLSFEGIQEVEGKETYVLKTQSLVDESVNFDFYDCQNFMLLKNEKDEENDKVETFFSDYKSVNGILKAFTQKTIIKAIGQTTEIRIKKFETNLEFEEGTFEPPEKDADDFEFLENNCVEDISFKFLHNHIYLKVKLNGTESLWVLDSGASVTVIDSVFAEKMNLTLEGKVQGKGLSGLVEVSFVKLPPLEIGGLHFKEQKVASIEIASLFRKTIGLEVVGILGFDFLSRLVTKIDYANEKISFYHPKTFAYKGNGTVLETPLKNRMLKAEMTVDGKFSGKWNVDLGAGGSSFHFPFAKENNLFEREGVERISMGADGQLKSKTIKFSDFEFGGFKVENPKFSVHEDVKVGAFADKEFVGNLGNNVFRNFVLYLDYESQKMIVEKGDDFGKEFPSDKSGLQIQRNEEGDFEVIFITPSSPAEESGFEVGDKVLSINGKDTESLGNLGVFEFLEKDEGTKLEFEVLRSDAKLDLKLVLKVLC
ncbi:MAG: PDZ domain-containing protein [Calditrichaeota bacterium]|nr:MAG: PDZ domain-containing protein [Calditrichota bacterium]